MARAVAVTVVRQLTSHPRRLDPSPASQPAPLLAAGGGAAATDGNHAGELELRRVQSVGRSARHHNC